MKRYEKMTKTELIDFFQKSGDCEKCIIREYCKSANIYCTEVRVNWLNEEITVKQVPRFMTAKTIDQMSMLRDEYENYCKVRVCNNCKYNARGGSYECFFNYLCKLVEVEEPCTTV